MCLCIWCTSLCTTDLCVYAVSVNVFVPRDAVLAVSVPLCLCTTDAVSVNVCVPRDAVLAVSVPLCLCTTCRVYCVWPGVEPVAVVYLRDRCWEREGIMEGGWGRGGAVLD